MPFLSWLISKVFGLFAGQAPERTNDTPFIKDNLKNNGGVFSYKEQSFDENYKFVRAMLKYRLDQKYPDGHYACLRADKNISYSPSEDRALAVDTMSTAIAMALREGATVQQAADIGAASVGI